MVEYSYAMRVKRRDEEVDKDATDWYLSLDTCLVAIRKAIEEEKNAESFLIGIVQRKHV